MPKNQGAIAITGTAFPSGPLILNFQTSNILDESEPLTVGIEPGSAPSVLWEACSTNPAMLAELQAALSAAFKDGWREGTFDGGVKFAA